MLRVPRTLASRRAGAAWRDAGGIAGQGATVKRDEDAVLLQVEGPLATITLNRPAVLNAMNLAWVHSLEAAVERVAAEPEVRVVVVGGAGRAFCAGIDLDMLGQEGMPPGFYEGQERAFRGL